MWLQGYSIGGFNKEDSCCNLTNIKTTTHMQSFLTQIQMSQNEQTALRDGPLNNSDEISLYEISNSVSFRDVLNLQVINKL